MEICGRRMMARRGSGYRVQGAGGWWRIVVGISFLIPAVHLDAQWLSPDTLTLPPAGYGRLSEEEVSLNLRTDDFIIRVQPVHPVTLRVVPRDAFDRITAILRTIESKIADGTLRSGDPEAGLVLVTFYGQAGRASFSPEELTIITAGRLLNASIMIPLTPNWENRVVGSRQAARALFVLNGSLNVLEPFTVTYRATTEAVWDRRRLRLLEDELARAKGRAAADAN